MTPVPLISANMIIDGESLNSINGNGTIRCKFNDLPLMPRMYYIWVEVYGEDKSEILFRWQRLASFQITSSKYSTIMSENKGAARFIKDHAPIQLDYEWLFD